MRFTLASLAGALLAGCLSSQGAADEAACAAPDPDQPEVCVGAAASHDACVSMRVDGPASLPLPDEVPILTVTEHDVADGQSERVPLVFQGNVFEESSDPALARISTIWVGPSEGAPASDAPADSLVTTTAASTPRYRLWLRFNAASSALEDGRVDVLDASTEVEPRITSIDLACGDSAVSR